MSRKWVVLLTLIVIGFFWTQVFGAETWRVHYTAIPGDEYGRISAYQGPQLDFNAGTVTYRYIVSSASPEAMTVPVSCAGYNKISLLRYTSDANGLPTIYTGSTIGDCTTNIMEAPMDIQSVTPQTYPLMGILGMTAETTGSAGSSSLKNQTANGLYWGLVGANRILSVSASVNSATQNWFLTLAK